MFSSRRGAAVDVRFVTADDGRVYVARPSGIERIALDGGTREVVAPGERTDHVVVDDEGIYWLGARVVRGMKKP